MDDDLVRLDHLRARIERVLQRIEACNKDAEEYRADIARAQKQIDEIKKRRRAE